jgi:hypothetical protein
MVGGLSADTEPIFDSIDIHADFLDFGFIFENFSCRGRGISGDWIVYANDFERFSLSSSSTKVSQSLSMESDFELATTMWYSGSFFRASG